MRQYWLVLVNTGLKSKEECKYQESIQSSTTPDPGRHIGKYKPRITAVYLVTTQMILSFKESSSIIVFKPFSVSVNHFNKLFMF